MDSCGNKLVFSQIFLDSHWHSFQLALVTRLLNAFDIYAVSQFDNPFKFGIDSSEPVQKNQKVM